MEATADVKGILGKIMPPRLEDAGLEDCALPPDAIKLAFAKAATAVRSVISSDDEETEGSCVKNPWPVSPDSSDELVGIDEGLDHVPGICANEKGLELPEFSSDAVEVRDEDQKTDEVLVGGPNAPESGDSCIDGLQGLQIGEKSEGKLGKKKSSGKVGKIANDEDESDGEKESEIPILTETLV